MSEQKGCVVEEDRLTQRKISRRSFLVMGTGAGIVAASLAVIECTPPVLPAEQTPSPPAGSLVAGTPTPAGTPQPTGPQDMLYFFNPNEAATIKAAVGRIIPGTPGDPGALEAGVDRYIDMALEGYYYNLQQAYRTGIARMNAYSNSKLQKNFADLTPDQQDQVLTDMQKGQATGFTGSQGFFAMLLQHTKEGMFSDPAYGGNRNLAGWNLIGFPGAQFAYGPTQMAPGFDQSTVKKLTNVQEQQTPPLLPKSGF